MELLSFRGGETKSGNELAAWDCSTCDDAEDEEVEDETGGGVRGFEVEEDEVDEEEEEDVDEGETVDARASAAFITRCFFTIDGLRPCVS